MEPVRGAPPGAQFEWYRGGRQTFVSKQTLWGEGLFFLPGAYKRKEFLE